MMLQADKALVGLLSAALTALDMGRIKDAKDLVEQAVTLLTYAGGCDGRA